MLKTSKRTPLCRWALRAATGRQHDSVTTSCSGQPKRAAASEKDDGDDSTHLITGNHSRRAGADTEQHRVAAGQNADRLAAQCQYRRQGKRAWPGLAFGANAGRQQVELTLGAEDGGCAEQGATRIFTQPAKAVFTDSHNC